MGLVAARCTQCGANIEVDDTKEAGICKFCGTAFITEKAITSYNTYVTNNFAGANINVVGGDIKNLLEIATNSLNGGNGKEAFEYANKALEIKADSSEAWIIKMRALEYVGTIGDPRVGEVVTCGKSAIQYATDEKKEEAENEVYKYYLSRALSLLVIATEKINDVTQLKQTFQTFAVVSALTAGQRTMQADSGTVNLMEGLSNNALLLKLAVPKEKISDSEEYQNLVKAVANQYVEYSKGLTERYAIYGTKLLDNAVESRRKILGFFKDGLSEENKNTVSENEINNEATNNGCYIATCVYGSYDCPQVWTLRRFRDYTLDETWYGRLFIKCYYAISPTLVKWFGEMKWFKSFWKTRLDKMVQALQEKGVSDARYQDKY
ncbi:MAG: hypothetical protein K2I22_05310 [Lachnospiraceae bacterium]|nr:hypothetical protein [Lachnospiraceae bacterium]